MINVEDARRLARRRLPRIFFDYLDGGAFGETTLRANAADFQAWSLEQRVLVGAPARDLSTVFLGERHRLPFMLAPIGFLGLLAGRGEFVAAQAAAAAGIPFCLSSFAIARIGDLRLAVAGPLAFQLYVLKDRGRSEAFIERARAAGVETLILTVDTAVTSVRERDVRHGFRTLTKITPGLLARFLLHPRWCLDMLRAGPPRVGAVADWPEFGTGLLAQAGALSRQIDPTLNWRDLAWLRQRWPGRLAIKGILSAADAAKARDGGADAVIVSNHGGRQLDGAPSTIAVLPDVAAAVGGSIEVLLDGGIRRGADVVKALALGASGVLLGRAYAYGLAAAGGAGVQRIIEILATEIDVTLGLMGIATVDELKARGPAALRLRPAPPTAPARG